MVTQRSVAHLEQESQHFLSLHTVPFSPAWEVEISKTYCLLSPAVAEIRGTMEKRIRFPLPMPTPWAHGDSSHSPGAATALTPT